MKISIFSSYFWRKVISELMVFVFAVGSVGTSYAQNAQQMPAPGTMLNLSEAFAPPLLKGIKVYPNNPFRLNFILDKGNSNDKTDELKAAATRLIKYFLASVTVPEKDLWVNLSPFEKDRIVPYALGQTEMGRDLLVQDYILKQFTASAIYPESDTGKKFWSKVYTETEKRFGTTDISVDTFNKVWIVPEKAVVYESKDSAYVVESRLKVMLESDYLAESETPALLSVSATDTTRELSKKILREVVIPILEKEVNEGKNFARLRQVYHSLILAIWYKDKVKESLFGKTYVDLNKTGGVDIEDKSEKVKIWTQYVEAFKKGAYNYIKEERDVATGEMIPRKYFSGGVIPGEIRKVYSHRMVDGLKPSDLASLPVNSNNRVEVLVNLDAAMSNEERRSDKKRVIGSDLAKVGPDDISISQNGFSKVLNNGPKVFKEFEVEVGGAENYQESSKEIIVKGQKFVLIRKLTKRGQVVFTLNKEQFDKLAELKEWKPKSTLPLAGSDDVSFTKSGFYSIFGSTLPFEDIQQDVVDAEGYPEDVKPFVVDGQTFYLERKLSGGRIVFTLNQERFKELTRLKRWDIVKGLSEVGGTDIPLGQNRFQEIFLGGKEIWKGFQKELEQVEDYSRSVKKVIVKGQEFIIVRKRVNTSVVLTLDKERFKELAELKGWKFRSDLPEINDDDVSFSGPGFRKALSNGQKAWDQFQVELGEAKSFADTVKIITINDKKFNLVRKRFAGQVVFTLNTQEFRRLAQSMGWQLREDMDDVIHHENLDNIVSELSEEPETLLGYLLLTTNLDPRVISQITRRSFEGFKGVNAEGLDLTDYKSVAGNILLINSLPTETAEPSILIEGKVQGAFDQVYMEGDRSRIIEINKDRTFRVRVILQAGEQLSLSLVPVNQLDQTFGAVVTVKVKQTSKPKNFEEIMIDLLSTKEEIAERITKDSVKLAYLKRRLEIGLLSHFTENEAEGFAFLDQKILDIEKPNIKRIYQDIRKKFNAIEKIDTEGFDGFKVDGFNVDEHLFFYQKYALYELLQGIKDYEEGRSGAVPARIIALEQGLGKTLVALAAVHANENGALVVAPSSVVSTWAEQDAHFFDNPLSVPIRGSSANKTEQLNQATPSAIRIVNVEFLRSTEQTRVNALNKNSQQMVVLDESQVFSREGSLQTQSAQKLKGKYTILISATPFATPQAARSLLKFITKQTGFSDAKIFDKYLMDNPDSLRLLHFLIDQYVIRIKKAHVFKTYDPQEPLEKQNNRLPQKVYIDPQDLGGYTLTQKQADSILDLFFDWNGWKQLKEELTRNQRATNTQDDRERSRAGELFFAKMHSLRQLMNDPRYAGIQEESPKHRKMDEIINREVVRNKGKVVIFCSYKEEVNAYLKRYAQYGAVSYYGDSLSDRVNADGYLVDATSRQPLLFRKINAFEYAVDENGQLIPDGQGSSITALDYNRYRFQYDPDARIIVVTYDTGGVGVTFTAADAVVFDDLPRDYTAMYQAEDRANRIDNLRKKYQTRYYRLEARYPQTFLESLKNKFAIFDRKTEQVAIVSSGESRLDEAYQSGKTVWDLEELFSYGTYDQIQGHNFMNVQRRIFNLVLDGLQDEDDLDLIGQAQLKEKLPVMFEQIKSERSDEAMGAVRSNRSEKTFKELYKDFIRNNSKKAMRKYPAVWEVEDDERIFAYRMATMTNDALAEKMRSMINARTLSFREDLKPLTLEEFLTQLENDVDMDHFLGNSDAVIKTLKGAMRHSNDRPDRTTIYQAMLEQAIEARCFIRELAKRSDAAQADLSRPARLPSEAMQNGRASPNSDEFGGIDLAPDKVNLETRGEGSGAIFKFDPATIQQLQNASGLTPVIIDIQPMTTTVLMFLGFKDETLADLHAIGRSI